MPANGVETLKIDFGQAAQDLWRARNVLQADLSGCIHTVIRRRGEVISAGKTHAEIANHAWREGPCQSDGDSLRTVFVGSERIIERPLCKAWQRPRSEDVAIHETVTTKQLLVLRKLMVESNVKLIHATLCDRS